MPRKAAAPSRTERRALFNKMVSDLKRERDELLSRVAELDAELAEYGADSAPVARSTARVAKAPKVPKTAKKRAKGGRGRGARSGSLKDYINKVVGASAMTPAQIAAAAVKAGYKSSSKTLPQSVSVACAQLVKSGELVKEGRGNYRAA